MKYDIKVDAVGNKYYYVDFIIHRENGPAIEYITGEKWWYKNGLLHREDGPAIEYANGNKIWYKNGDLHREDGPAKEYANGYKEWRLNNKEYGHNNDFTNESWKKFVKTIIFS